MIINDLDLNKKYNVEGFESQFTGLDLLVLMDKMKTAESTPSMGLVYDHPYHYTREGSSLFGRNGVNRFSSLKCR